MKHQPLLFLCLLLSSGILKGQPFSLDTTFQSNHPFRDNVLYDQLGVVLDLSEETNGSLMVVGNFQYLTGDKRLNIIRLSHYGMIDPGWNPSTWVTRAVLDVQKVEATYYFTVDYVGLFRTDQTGDFFDNALIPLDTNFHGGLNIPYVFPDGSIITGGTGGKYPSANNFQRRLYFMRIRPDGYVDSSFHHNTNIDVLETHRYDASRLLLYGNYLTAYDSLPVNKLCLIDTLGNLDTTFYSGLFDWGPTRPEYIQPDGKIVIGGRFTLHNYPDTLNLIRLNPDGSLDSTFNNFNSALGGRNSVYAVCPTSDGGLLVGGNFSTYQGYSRNRIVKTDADGFIDLQYFNGEGIDSSKNHWEVPAEVRNILPAQNDKYYVMGHFLKYDGQVVRPLIRILGLSHTVGIEAAPPPQVRVYPNPAAGDVRVEWEPQTAFVRLRIVDTEGRTVVNREFAPGESSGVWTTNGLAAGVYLYELRRSDQALLGAGKVVVQ